MDALLQSVASGVVTGSIYALVALSLVIIFKSTEVVNFGGGDVAMVGAYVGLFAIVFLELPYPYAFALAAVGLFVMGIAFEWGVLRTVVGGVDPSRVLISLVIATLGLSYVLRGAVRLFNYTDEVRRLPTFFRAPPIFLGPVILQYQDIIIVGISCALMAILYVFFQHTLFGKGLRATSMNAKAAQLIGIPTGAMRLFAWGIACALAAIAGVLIGSKLPMTPDFGSQVVLLAFAAAIIGGFSSLPGCIVGGILLGVVQNLVGLFVSSSATALAPFLVIMVVLIVRPQGLFGGRVAIKKV